MKSNPIKGSTKNVGANKNSLPEATYSRLSEVGATHVGQKA